jgi:acetyl-CoA synthetase
VAPIGDHADPRQIHVGKPEIRLPRRLGRQATWHHPAKLDPAHQLGPLDAADGHNASLRDDLKAHVATKIGAIARPDDIFFSADLPKTRSGKIMRRLLKDIAEGRALGDTTTLADPAVVARLKDQYESEEG